MLGDETLNPDIDSENDPPRKQRRAEKQKQSDRREISQHILLVNAAQKSSHQQKGKSTSRLKDADVRLFFAISGRNPHVLNAKVEKVQVDQHVILKEKPFVNRL